MSSTESDLIVDATYDDAGYAIWSDEIEAMLHRHVNHKGWFVAVFRQGEKSRTALVHGRVWATANRQWTVRGILLVDETSDAADYSLFLQYPGEDRRLPGGGLKMYPRIASTEVVTGRCSDARNAEVLIRRVVDEVDEMHEQAHHLTVASMDADPPWKRLLKRPWWQWW